MKQKRKEGLGKPPSPSMIKDTDMDKTVDITRWHSILTEKEVDRLRAKAARIGWGFSRSSLEKEICRFESGTVKAKAKVYYLLEDCNYNDVAGALAEHDVATARVIADRIFQNL